jgi:hypothetical protein
VVEVEVFEYLLLSDVFVVHLDKLLCILCTDHFAFYVCSADGFLSAVLIKQFFELVLLNQLVSVAVKN